MALLELKGVRKGYGGAPVLRDINLEIERGEFVAIVGYSGAGKTTLVSMMAGLIKPDAGTLLFDGKPITSPSTVLSMVAGLQKITEGAVIIAGKEVTGPGPDRGVVFQSPSLLHWLSALDNVLLGVDQVFRDKSSAEREAIAKHYLTLVGLEDAFDKKPPELSAGMRQRVGLARAFALHPRVLLLDEPFGMLDSLTRIELQEALIEMWRIDKKTALMVTHDVDEALFLSDRIAMMTQGPNAKLGGIIEVPFPRPRTRRSVLEHLQYDALRDEIIGFLESQETPLHAA